MPPDRVNLSAVTMPAGYRALRLPGSSEASAVQLCVVVRPEPDDAGGHLVTLRSFTDAAVLLGVVTDSQARPLRWVELWVQQHHGLDGLRAARGDTITNQLLDHRWARRADSFERLAGDAVVVTGWERAAPPPMLIDLGTMRVVEPMDEHSRPWRLCVDDALLAEHGLAPYSQTLHRYLFTVGQDKPICFLPLTPEAPGSASCVTDDELLTQGGVDLNRAAGRILCKTFWPVDLRAMLSVLHGRNWTGVRHGKHAIDLDGNGQTLSGQSDHLSEGEGDAQGRIFLGRHGRWGRVVETFHLKLRYLADAVQDVASLVELNQRPHLHLHEDRFRVDLGPVGPGLPWLWTARVRLSDPSEAFTLTLPDTDAVHHLSLRPLGSSIYRPDFVAHHVRGTGRVRIRQIRDGAHGTSIVEGTFDTTERLKPAVNDMVCLELRAADQPVTLFAHLEADPALAKGEWRFRTAPQRLSVESLRRLRGVAGVPLDRVEFEHLPLLSTPADLYALGVLAVRVLLVNQGTTLPLALDETLSLARQVALEADDQTPLPERIRRIAEHDPRWIEQLGPQRLTDEVMTAAEAFELAPAALWWETLAMIVRTFPGEGPDSTCRDFADARPEGLHRVFAPLATDLWRLIHRTRGLIVNDSGFNREIQAVIHLMRSSLDAPASAKPARLNSGDRSASAKT